MSVSSNWNPKTWSVSEASYSQRAQSKREEEKKPGMTGHNVCEVIIRKGGGGGEGEGGGGNIPNDTTALLYASHAVDNKSTHFTVFHNPLLLCGFRDRDNSILQKNHDLHSTMQMTKNKQLLFTCPSVSKEA